jgi:hypothetical protein
MDIEIVTNKMPAGGLLISGNDRLHMREKICLCSRGSGVGSHNLSSHHIAAEDKSACAVANVLKLASLHFSGSQRQAGVFAQKSPEPQSVHPYSLSVLLVWPGRELVDRPDRSLQWFLLSADQPEGSTSSGSDAV